LREPREINRENFKREVREICEERWVLLYRFLDGLDHSKVIVSNRWGGLESNILIKYQNTSVWAMLLHYAEEGQSIDLLC